MLDLIEMIIFRFFITTIKKWLKTFDIRTGLQTIFDGLVDRIKKKDMENFSLKNCPHGKPIIFLLSVFSN
jgi:hypothetical protein